MGMPVHVYKQYYTQQLLDTHRRTDHLICDVIDTALGCLRYPDHRWLQSNNGLRYIVSRTLTK